MAVEDTVELPDLSPAQEEALKKRWGLTQSVAPVVPQLPSLPTEDPSEGPGAKRPTYVFTNLLNGDLMIPDLGFKLPGGGFEAFVFKPHQTIDLMTVFKRRDIENSRYLRASVTADPPLLKAGNATPAELRQGQDPLSRRVLEHVGTEGAFPDTSPLALKGGPAETEYDQKLQELREKEEQEERDTRK